MRILRVVLIVAVAGAVLGSGGSAAGGGNWIEFKRRYNPVGAEVVARNIFFARSRAEVTRHAPYFAYLAPRGTGWELPDPNAPGVVRLGRVEVRWPSGHYRYKRASSPRGSARYMAMNPRARIGFEVPDLPPGNYLMSFCDASCEHRLGDVDTTGFFSITATSAEADLKTYRDRLRTRVRALSSRLSRVAFRTRRRAQRELNALDAARLQADLRADRLEAATEASRDDERTAWRMAAAALLACLMLSGAIATLAVILRRRARSSDLDGEMKELMAAESITAADR